MMHLFSENTKLNLLVNYTDSPYAGDSGGLTLDEVQEDRTQARSRNVDYKTQESIEQFKTGLSILHKWEQNTLSSYAFYSTRNFYGLLPFEHGGIVDLSRSYYGFGSAVTLNGTFAKAKNKLQLGVDFANQKDNRDRYKNLLGNHGDQT